MNQNKIFVMDPYLLAIYSHISSPQQFDDVYGDILYDIGIFAHEIGEGAIACKYYNLSVKENNTNAMAYVGMVLCCVNPEKGEQLLLKAAAMGNVNTMTMLTIFYYNAENYEEMKKYGNILVERGIVWGMRFMGSYYHVEKNYERMKKCYDLAVDHGDIHSACKLGLYYQNVEKNYRKMKIYYDIVLEKGDEKMKAEVERYLEEDEINTMIDTTSYFMKSENKNLQKLIREMFENHGENNTEIECVICKINKDRMLNFRCIHEDARFDHFYCLECFCEWYEGKDLKCILCFADIKPNNIILLCCQHPTIS